MQCALRIQKSIHSRTKTNAGEGDTSMTDANSGPGWLP